MSRVAKVPQGIIGYVGEMEKPLSRVHSSRAGRCGAGRRLFVAFAAVAALAACGGGSGGESDGGFEWSKDCVAAAEAGLPTTSSVCADSGLRPGEGGFLSRTGVDRSQKMQSPRQPRLRSSVKKERVHDSKAKRAFLSPPHSNGSNKRTSAFRAVAARGWRFSVNASMMK